MTTDAAQLKTISAQLTALMPCEVVDVTPSQFNEFVIGHTGKWWAMEVRWPGANEITRERLDALRIKMNEDRINTTVYRTLPAFDEQGGVKVIYFANVTGVFTKLLRAIGL